jgi:hypothetical protein
VLWALESSTTTESSIVKMSPSPVTVTLEDLQNGPSKAPQKVQLSPANLDVL